MRNNNADLTDDIVEQWEEGVAAAQSVAGTAHEPNVVSDRGRQTTRVVRPGPLRESLSTGRQIKGSAQC